VAQERKIVEAASSSTVSVERAPQVAFGLRNCWVDDQVRGRLAYWGLEHLAPPNFLDGLEAIAEYLNDAFSDGDTTFVARDRDKFMYEVSPAFTDSQTVSRVDESGFRGIGSFWPLAYPA
jgi:hypothetical protein